ncbi:hypothetical protein HNR71_005267 [Kribbella sandramycini]|uniref:Uncharacterized protein n=1 Tax=Kribbella sandramycini TaxID=60450 RepID=A0A841SJ80_9ACTN|nr:hypothetical protein [Kribbella sandramycini]
MRPRSILLAALITISAAGIIWSIVRGETAGIISGALILIGMSALVISERKPKGQ